MKEQRRIHARHVLSDRQVETAYDQVQVTIGGVRGAFAELREKAIALREEGWEGGWDDLRGPNVYRANGISGTEIVWSLDIERENEVAPLSAPITWRMRVCMAPGIECDHTHHYVVSESKA
jgi:hypothetical protein